MLPLEIFFHVTVDFDNFGPSVYIYVPHCCGILTLPYDFGPKTTQTASLGPNWTPPLGLVVS